MKYKNILLCTDYSEDADTSFVHAFDQAVKYGATLHILNVIPSVNPCSVQIYDDPMQRKEALKKSENEDEQYRLQALGALKKGYAEQCRGVLDYRMVIKVGSPDIEIIKYSEENEIDMIVMGTAGRQENKRLTYIRTAANVAKYANCQVINIGSLKQ